METTKTEIITPTTEFKMEMGLNKNKDGIYILTKNKITAYCPFQFPSMGQNFQGHAVQASQPCTSLCAKFELLPHSQPIGDGSGFERSGGLVVRQCCGQQTNHTITKENIINVK